MPKMPPPPPPANLPTSWYNIASPPPPPVTGHPPASPGADPNLNRPPPPPPPLGQRRRRSLGWGPDPQDEKFTEPGMYTQQKQIADVMLYPKTTEEQLFSLSARDWLSKAFMASGVGSGLPTRPGATPASPLLYQGAKYHPYPESAYPEVVGMPYKVGRKSAYGCTGGQGEVKTLPQRLKEAFEDGSLNLPEQCLWNMEIKGGCHDPHFTLKSSLSGKALAHPNMAGTEAGGRQYGLVLSRDKFTPLTFSTGMSGNSDSRWTGWPTCDATQHIGSSQRKTCLAEHKCYACATHYADCNGACADPSVPKGTTGEPSMAAYFNATGVKWGGSDVCHRAPVMTVGASVLTFNGAGTVDATVYNPTPGPGSVVLALQVQQHRKDIVAPQLFNVTLTYERPGMATPITRSHLLAYESGSSIALEQIKGVPCGGPISLTAAACVETADSRVDCNFPATRKTLSSPCPAPDAAESSDAAPASATEAGASSSSSSQPPAHAAPTAALPSPSTSSPATSTSTAAPAQQPSTQAVPGVETLAARTTRMIERSHHARAIEAVIGVSLVLLLGSGCYLLVRRLFRPAVRADRLIDEAEGSAGRVRYDKRPVAASHV